MRVFSSAATEAPGLIHDFVRFFFLCLFFFVVITLQPVTLALLC